MADIDQLLLELRALQRKFELAITIPDFDDSFLVFDQLRKIGTFCLWRVWDCGYLRSIPGSRRAFDLFDDLIGFSPSEHLDQDIFGCVWIVQGGLIEQSEVWTGIQSKQAPDEMAVWNKCGFQLLTGCANGLGRLIEIIEREMAADNQADSDDTDDGDGLFENDRILVWGGVRFTLTTNQAIVFRLLVEAYPGDVAHGSFGDKGIGDLRDSFRFNNTERKKRGTAYHPCWHLIVSGSVKDSKRLIDPSIVRSDPKKFSDPQHNPQQSPT
jgi:hypothetical protein